MPVFAHPRLTADAYGKAVSRWFDAGIQVPIVIFADPTGREIPGTRLDHRQAPIKGTYLDHAARAMKTFLGGRSPAKAREAWQAFGKALRTRQEGEDPGAAVADLVRLRDAAPRDDPMRASVDAFLAEVDEEAQGFLAVAELDLDGADAAAAIAQLFQLVRDYPGLATAGKAQARLDGLKEDPERKAAWAAAERPHRAWLALREADSLARAGKKAEARKAYDAVAKEFEGTPAAAKVAERKGRLEEEK